MKYFAFFNLASPPKDLCLISLHIAYANDFRLKAIHVKLPGKSLGKIPGTNGERNPSYTCPSVHKIKLETKRVERPCLVLTSGRPVL